jgi:phage protein U
VSIGTFGSITFEVSTEKTRTFDDFKRKTAVKFEQHDIIGLKAKLEFISPGLDEISFQVVFSAYHGLKPLNEANQLREIVTKGEYNSLVIGGKALGNFVVESMNEAWKYIDNQGNVFYIAIDVSLKEYYIDSNSAEKPVLASTVTEEKKVEKVTRKVEKQAKETGLSTQNIADLAAIAVNGVRDPSLATASISSILTATQGLQGGNPDGQAKNAYVSLGLDVTSLVTQSVTDPMSTAMNVLTRISETETTDKMAAAKGIYGAKAAGSVLLIAQKLKG